MVLTRRLTPLRDFSVSKSSCPKILASLSRREISFITFRACARGGAYLLEASRHSQDDNDVDVADQSIYAGNVSDKRQEALDAVGWDSLCFAQILDDAEEILNAKIRGE